MFTKWVAATPLNDKIAVSIADALYIHLICCHGVPKSFKATKGLSLSTLS
jgi:hypothetical protein